MPSVFYSSDRYISSVYGKLLRAKNIVLTMWTIRIRNCVPFVRIVVLIESVINYGSGQMCIFMEQTL